MRPGFSKMQLHNKQVRRNPRSLQESHVVKIYLLAHNLWLDTGKKAISDYLYSFLFEPLLYQLFMNHMHRHCGAGV